MTGISSGRGKPGRTSENWAEEVATDYAPGPLEKMSEETAAHSPTKSEQATDPRLPSEA